MKLFYMQIIICIASGAYPKIIQYDWLKKSEHDIEEPVPSLFTFNMPGNPVTALMGVSVENAAVKIVGTKLSEEGPLLITHWGMSGPAILKFRHGVQENWQNENMNLPYW